MTDYFGVVAAALFGCILGSFINVVALRDNKRKTIVKGRSTCPHCHHLLHWYDLVPVLSFLSLGGKCRYCKKTISWRYPVVELVSAALVATTWQVGMGVYGNVLVASGLTVCGLLLLIVALIDLQSYTVPVEYVVASGIIGSGGLLLTGNLGIQDALLGLLVGAGSLAFVLYGWKLAFKEGMGEGDLWIAGAIGAVVGYPSVIVALMAAVFMGALGGGMVVAISKKGLGSQIPFGPFLAAGWLIALLWGQSIIEWYILGL